MNQRDAATLDQVISSLLSPASTPDQTPMLAYKLVARPQVRRVRPTHPRSQEEILPDLRQQLLNIANGSLAWPLYLWSPGPGSGKTCAALSMLDNYGSGNCHGGGSDVSEFLGGFADFASLPELFRMAEQKRLYTTTASDGCQTVYLSDLWAFVRTDKLLVLDDLRKPSDREQRLGEDHFGILKRILDLRIGKPLIITSNVDPWSPPDGSQSDLVRLFDDRIADRITCGTVYKLACPSRR